jgi:hypothetical protein
VAAYEAAHPKVLMSLKGGLRLGKAKRFLQEKFIIWCKMRHGHKN